MKNLVKRFAADESGATAIEYGLIAAGLSIAVIAAVNLLGPKLGAAFQDIGQTLTTATNTRVPKLVAK
ncbi:MAG: Flp family type IVb pilin [Rhizobiales bacterium]|nr:Flp family type IVb pilin [Hyphomicrobiales bacterium]